MTNRINKHLSLIGYCSRRKADELIIQRRVKINNKIAQLGDVVTDKDEILIDNKPVNIEEEKIYLKVYKPRGIVCTTAKFDKNNIIDFIGFKKRIYPIGRLDKESEGLILMTNDGSIVNPILKASNNHEKEYIVEFDKAITDDAIKKLEKGVSILGVRTKKCRIKRMQGNRINIVITQGLNRQIRRMAEVVGLKVVSLKRVRIINVLLGDLSVGQYRELTKMELKNLKKSIGYDR